MSIPTSSTPTISQEEGEKVIRNLRLSRMVWPVLFGLTAVIYLLYTQFDAAQFRSIEWSARAWAWIGVSFILLVMRHFFYAMRLRTVTGRFFSWRKCLELMVIWEFSTSLTPTSKGGPLVMLFVLTREKLSGGRTAAAIFYTTLCDSGFFVLTVPCWLAIYGPKMLYPGTITYSASGLAAGTFFTTYAIMAIYWVVMVLLFLARPQVAQVLLGKLAKMKILKRFSEQILRWGHEFTLAAAEIKTQKWRYHIRMLLATLGVWTCKFAMINCLMIAIAPEIALDGFTQVFIYARLVAMFVIMTFAPTPGGSGIAETLLPQFISDYVPAGIGLVVALLWRGMAYYGYLLVGAIIVPRWLMGLKKQPVTTPA